MKKIKAAYAIVSLLVVFVSGESLGLCVLAVVNLLFALWLNREYMIK